MYDTYTYTIIMINNNENIKYKQNERERLYFNMCEGSPKLICSSHTKILIFPHTKMRNSICEWYMRGMKDKERGHK